MGSYVLVPAAKAVVVLPASHLGVDGNGGVSTSCHGIYDALVFTVVRAFRKAENKEWRCRACELWCSRLLILKADSLFV
jgi:hypothetical protein